MARVSRNRVNGVYSNLATSRADYTRAFGTLYQELIRSPKFGQSDYPTLLARLNALPKDYRGLRFALVGTMEHTTAFLSERATFGPDLDSNNRPVMGFGFDFAYQQGSFLDQLNAARIPVNARARAAIEAFDAYQNLSREQKLVRAVQLRNELIAAGFQISREQAVRLFDVAADTNYEVEVSRIFERIPESVERAAIVASVFNGLTTAPFNNAIKSGRFEEAYVILAFSNTVPQSTHERPMINAAVFGRTSAGDPTQLSLTSALDFVDALQRWAPQIDAKRSGLNANEDTRRFIADFEGQMNALKGQINEVTSNNGMFVSYTGQDSLADIARQTGVRADWLNTVYGGRAPGRYASVFLPVTVPNRITGSFRPSDVESGRSHIVADTGSSFYSFAIENTERPRSTFIMDKFGRPVGLFDAGPRTPTFTMSRGTDGSVTMHMPNGSTIRYLSQDGVDHPVDIVWTNAGGQVTRRSGKAFFTVDGNSNFVVTQRWTRTEYTHNDLNGINGLGELLSLPGMGGRVQFAGPGAALPTDQLIDLDGDITSELTEALDGTRTETISFHLDNRGEGVGDPIVQTLVYRPGQNYAHTQTIIRGGRDAVVTERRVNNTPGSTNFGGIKPEITIEYPNKVITFEQFGSIFGSALGKQIGGGNVVAQIGMGALLGTVAANLGEVADNFLNDPLSANGRTGFSSSQKIDEALQNLPEDFLAQLKSAGIGAISSFLTAELFNALNIDGTVGEFGQAITGAYISAIMEALPALAAGTKSLTQVFGAVNVANVAGSFIGSKLASEVMQFNSIGGQLGASIGSAVGSLVGGKIIGQIAGTLLGGPLGTLVGAAIGAFVGQLLGGALGSVFGGTPRSGAEVHWDGAKGGFTVANAYARKGGSKQMAIDVSTAVAESFNSVLKASGSELLDPASVQAGSYGMRNKDFVYRPVATRDKHAITARFSGTEAGGLISHGAYLGLSSMIGQMAGGDTIVKRAIQTNLNNANGNPDVDTAGAAGDFSMETLMGDIAVAFDYNAFLANPDPIIEMIAAQPNSSFAASWAITFQRARELGLHRRAATDWTGGYSVWLDGVLDGKLGGESVSPANLGLMIDGETGNRSWVIYDAEGYIVDIAEDEIDLAAQTRIVGTSGSDNIRLGATGLSAPSAGTNEWLTVDGAAQGSASVAIDVAATIEAGDGDDYVQASNRGDTVMGGGGIDRIYGGLLDDWLLGEDGNDWLYAGAAGIDPETNLEWLGGNGNYLSGGDGEDHLFGREGSDWLDGGAGLDDLDGGSGDDILTGGAGDGDTLKGGLGDDQYLLRSGDGADFADETANVSVVGAPVPNATYGNDFIRARYAGILGNIIERNWHGDKADIEAAAELNKAPIPAGTTRPVAVAAVAAGGEDSIVFGAGIDVGDVVLARDSYDVNGVKVTTNDLRITIMSPGADGNPASTGTSLVIKDWFVDPLKRVEWLKFADGNELRIGDTVTFIMGTPGNDVIIGTNGNDFAYGAAGDDEIRLLAGNDIGNGGSGNDVVFGDEDRDYLIGGLGQDKLYGGTEADMLSGDAGDDELDGGSGQDVLSGGRGNDRLMGGEGADTFKFNRGDGRDTIAEDEGVTAAASDWQAVWNLADGWMNGFEVDPYTNEVHNQYGDYLRMADYTGVYDGRPNLHWQGRLHFDADTATYYRWIGEGAPTGMETVGFDRIEFGLGIDIQDIQFSMSGTDLKIGVTRDDAELGSSEQISDGLTVKNWAANRRIGTMAFYQTGEIDIGAGPSGKDILAGTDLAETITGDGNAEWATGGAGDDTIIGNGGNDILNGGSGYDTLRGGDGSDVIYGGAGNDSLEGGAQADVLLGGAGEDTASYANAAFGVAVDLAGTSPNTGDAAGDEFDSVEHLTGSDHADRLSGDEGENVIEGGKGADLLRGRSGDDTYVWNRGDGSDVIADSFEEVLDASGAINSNYSEFWQSVPVYEEDNSGGHQHEVDQPIIGDGGGTIIGYNWTLVLTDPSGEVLLQGSWSSTDGDNPPRADALASNNWSGGYTMTGNGLQVARGSADDGSIDTLELGEGIGFEHLAFARSGNDLLITVSEPNTLPETWPILRLRDQHPDSVLGSRIETLSFVDGLTVPLAAVRLGVSGADGADDFVLGGAGDETLTGGSGNDALTGGGGVNQLHGGAGDDIFVGGTGTDHFHGDAGARDTVRYDGSAGVRVDLSTLAAGVGGHAQGDTFQGIENVRGSAGDDVLIGDGADNELVGLGGQNLLTGNGGNDLLVGGSGIDTLHGDAGNDELQGGGGDDSLWGGDGDDRIAGGAGTDTVRGGTGNDEYAFDLGDGGATIIDNAGKDVVLFGDGIGSERLWLTKSGGDLSIRVLGTDDSVTVSGFFATPKATSVEAVRAGGRTLFLGHADTLELINRMSAATDVTTTMPATIAADLTRYWDEGINAAPRTSETQWSLSVNQDQQAVYSAGYQIVDHDSQTQLSYKVSGDDLPAHGNVEVNAVTGAVTYRPEAGFHGSDSFTVAATDPDGLTVRLPFNVTVNASPYVIGAEGGEISVKEGTTTLAGAPGSAARLTASDAESQAITWSIATVDGIAQNAGGRFAVAADGTVSVTNPSLIDYETAQAHTIWVRATDSAGAFSEASVTIAVTDANDVPDAPAPDGASGMVSERTTGWFARFVLTDDEGTPQLKVFDNPGALFTVAGNEVRFKTAPDFKTLLATGLFTAADSDNDGLREITINGTVKAYDTVGDSVGATPFTAVVEDVNDLPAKPTLSYPAATIVERDRVATGITRGDVVIGTVKIAEDDAPGEKSGSYNYLVYENGAATASDRFAVVNGDLRLLANKSLNYESEGASIDLKVVATDKTGTPFTVFETFRFVIEDALDVLDGDAGDNGQLDGQSGKDLIRGFAGTDRLTGGAGDDTLDGGTGNDTMIGGIGNDAYVVDAAGDIVTELAGEGTDSVTTTSATYVLPDHVENLTSTVSTGATRYTGNSGNNRISTGGADDMVVVLSGGNDWIETGAGNDIVVISGGFEHIDFGAGTDQLVLQGVLVGSFGQVSIHSFESVALLSGSDTRFGPAGGLAYYDLATVEATIAAGTTLVMDSATTAVGETVRIDARAETDGSLLIFGGKGTDTFLGGAGADTFAFRVQDGFGAADRVDGGAGSDVLELRGTYARTFAADAIKSIEVVSLLSGASQGTSHTYVLTSHDANVAAGERLTVYGGVLGASETLTFDGSAEKEGSFALYGGAANDTLTSGLGNDTLSGGSGDDTLTGGAGADVHDGGAGVDTASYAAAAAAVTVDLTTTGTAGDATGDTYFGVENVVGGAFADTLYGSNEINIVSGGDGNDILDARAGNDTIYGGAGDDTIRGGSGNDAIYGGLGIDTVTFQVDGRSAIINLSDAAVTANGVTVAARSAQDSIGGIDTLDSIENVMGSALADTIYGSAGNNLLNGGIGTDTMAGGAGHDTYVVDTQADVVTEAAGEGTDLVATNLATYVLTAANVENLYGWSGTAQALTGNSLNNDITTLGGNDTLDGGAGNDILRGGAGNDTYIVDSIGDAVTEDAGAGIDEVKTGIADYTLAANAENLTATSTTTGQTLRGNSLNNVVKGTAFSDIVYLQSGGTDTVAAGDGNDILYVGGALDLNDRLDGGAGTDTIFFQGSTTITLTADIAKNIERLSFLPANSTIYGGQSTTPHTYVITTTDATVAAGTQTRINGNGMVAGESLTFDGSAETDGSFYFFVSTAADNLKGGAGNDYFQLNAGTWQAGDRISGGNGLVPGSDDDVLSFRGGVSVVFAADSLAGIERITADAGADYSFTMHDGNVAANGKLKVEAMALGIANKLVFDGSLETNALLEVTGGLGNDVITGGNGRDILSGGGGDDTLKGMGGGDDLTGGIGDDTMVGGEGNDTYYVSRHDGHDIIQNFDNGGYDKLTLRTGITYKDIWFERIAGTTGPDDLKIFILGANGVDNSVTVQDWFSPTNPDLFRIELITEGTDRATTGIDVDTAIQEMSKHTRPGSNTAFQSLMSTNAALNAAVEAAWAHLVAPQLVAVADAVGTEPLDNNLGTVTIPVRAYYQDTTGRGILIPASHLNVFVVATNGANLADYVVSQSPGTPDANGNRTVTLTLTQNGSTHLLQNGSLPLEMRAQVRDVVDADGTRTAKDPFTLTIAPTADTATLSASAPGGNAGTRIPITINTLTPDKDGSERVDVLIGNIPAGYTLTNAAGAAVGTAVGTSVLVGAAQLAGLHLNAPAGRFEDANLTLTPRSVDGTSTRDGTPVQLLVVVNGAPTSASLNASVNENAANGTAVGTVVGVDPDGDALTYTLLDNAGGRFALTTGGQLTVANGALLNFETATSHNVVVRVSDNGVAGQAPLSITTTLAVTVKNVNEANSFTSSPIFTVKENVAAGAPVGSFTATDIDTTAPFNEQRYSFRNDSTGDIAATTPDGLYAINGMTGAITVAGALNHETMGTAKSYTVVARDNAGASPFNEARGTVTIGVEDVNEANALPASYAFSVNENVAVGAPVGTVAATDPDSTSKSFGKQRYYFLNGGAASATSADGRYAIDSVSGAIKTAAAINYETMSAPVDYTVVARDNEGASPYFQASSTVRIGVGNVNEAPNAPTGPASRFADEANTGSSNAAQAGLLFASYGLSDPDGAAPALQFASGGNPGNWFTISGGNVHFAPNFDFEWAKNSGYSVADYNGDGRQDAFIGNVVVQANDGSLASGTTGTAFYLSDVNERPSALTKTGENFYSETLPGESGHFWQTIATFSATDPDGPAPALTIVGGNANNWFTVSGNSLAFANANFSTDWLRSQMGNYGQDATWGYDRDGDGLKEVRVATLTLAAADAGGLKGDTFTYNVLIEDRNEAPYWSANPYSFTLNENAAGYTYFGTVAGADPDGAASELRYVFTGSSAPYFDGNIGYVSRSGDGRFLINIQNGQVFVNGAQALDYESGQTSFSYATTVTDRSGGAHALSQAGTLTINLQNVNEPHSMRANAITVGENQNPAAYTPVPTLSGVNDARTQMLTDPENGAVRWQFGNGTTASGPWRIDAATGKIWQGESVDYEALTTSVTYETYWDGAEYQEYPVYSNDPSLAVFNLAVQAVDDSTGQVASSNLQLTVADVNEAVTTSSSIVYRSGGGAVLQNSGTNFYVKSDRNNGTVVHINAYDPEGRALSYSIANQVTREINVSYGGNDEIDGGYPVLSIDGMGTIGFTVYGDPDWEGGTKINSTRRTLSIEYSFDVNITDSAGMTTVVPYTLTFLRRNSTIPPIVLDLDLDGVELVSFHGSTVTFDMDSDGVRDTTGWVGSDDGLLALDRDGNGTIDHISEISFVGDLTGAVSDLEGLSAFDTDGSGSLDAGDARYGEFRVWRDANQDGVSQAGELRTLAEAGVQAVDLSFERTGAEPTASDNVVYATAQWRDAAGAAHAVGDVFFAYDPSNLDTIAAPIVLDYDGDGSGLVSVRDSTARFDMNGDGSADRTGWIAKGDALLVLDRNGDGIVNDVSEISFTADKAGAQTDLEGLAAFDSNGDGSFDSKDARFGSFQLWFDRNGDGVSAPDELRTLAQAGISSISLKASATEEGGESSGSNLIFGRGSFIRHDGSAGTLLDAGLAYLAGGGDSTIAFSGWDGGTVTAAAAPATPTAPTPATPAPATATPSPANVHAIDLVGRGFSGKSGRYALTASGGRLFVTDSKAEGAIDARVQEVRPASILSFRGSAVGLVAPVVLDLDGDGVELRGRSDAKARFDMDGNGSRDDTGWISKQDGFVVVDLDGDGRITSAAELSLLGLKKDAKSGLDALATLDSDRSGSIDDKDARFGDLKLWVDRNGNGVTDAGELSSLADRNIAAIGLGGRAVEAAVEIGRNAMLATSTFTRTDGSTGSVGDAALAFRPGKQGSGLLDGIVAAARAADAGSEAEPDGAEQVAALRAGLSSRPFGDLDLGGSSLFERYATIAPQIAEIIGAASASSQAGALAEPVASRMDLPRMAVEAADEAPATAVGDVADLQLARIVQDMASFGPRSGEGDWRRGQQPHQSHVDYFA